MRSLSSSTKLSYPSGSGLEFVGFIVGANSYSRLRAYQSATPSSSGLERGKSSRSSLATHRCSRSRQAKPRLDLMCAKLDRTQLDDFKCGFDGEHNLPGRPARRT